MKKKISKNPKLWLQILFGYAILMLVLYIGIYPSIHKTVDDTNNNLIQSQQVELNTKIDKIDEQVSYLKDLTIKLRNNTDFSRLVVSSVSINTDYYTTMNKAKIYMASCYYPSSLVIKPYFIFKYNNVLISNDAVIHDLSNTYGLSLSIQGLDYSEFRDYLSYKKTPVYLPETSVKSLYAKEFTKDLTSIPFIIPAYFQNSVGSVNYDAALVCFLNTQEISTLIRTTSSRSTVESFIISSADGTVLYNSNPNYDTEKSSATRLISKPTQDGLIITTYVQNSEFINKNKSILSTFIKFSIMAFVIAYGFSLMVYYLQNRKTFTLKKKLKNMSENTISDDDLSAAISTMPYELSQIKVLYKEKLNTLYENEKLENFKKLISDTPIDKAIIDNYFPFLDNQYVVAFVTFHPIVVEEYTLSEESYTQLFAVHLQKLIELSIKNEKYCAIINRNTLVFVVGDDFDDKWKFNLSNQIKDIQRDIHKTFGTKCYFSFSQTGNYPNNFYKLYLQAFNNFRLCYQPNRFETMFCNNSTSTSRIPLDLAELQTLSNYMKEGNVEKCLEIMHNLKSFILKSENYDEVNISGAFNTLHNIVIFAANDLGIEIEFPSYDCQSTIYDMLTGLEESIVDFCGYMEKCNQNHNDTTIKEIQSYIKENYSKPELCIKDIAIHLNLSEKYIYAFVKEKTDNTIGGLILDVRMEKATKMLLENDYNVNEISEKCGFSSANTFYKAFKRIYGEPPGVWRDNNI